MAKNPLAEKLGNMEERIRGLEGGYVDEVNSPIETYWDFRAKAKATASAGLGTTTDFRAIADSAHYAGMCEAPNKLADTFKYGLSFDGAGDYVQVPDSPSLRLTELVLEVKVNLRKFRDFGILAGKQPINGGGPGQMSYSLWTYADGRVVGYIGSGAANNQATLLAGQVYAGRDVWLAMRVKDAAFELALNGVTKVSQPKTITVQQVADPFFIGMQNYCPDAVIKEVRLWSGDRTDAQLQACINADLTGNEAGLVGLWHLNEGAGVTVYDATPNANHGTITGAAWVKSFGMNAPAEVDVMTTPGAATLGRFNLCPPFAQWTLSNGAYVDADGVLVLPNANSQAVSPYIPTYAHNVDIVTSAEYYSDTPIDGQTYCRYLLNGAYFDGNFAAAQNRFSSTSNGRATQFAPPGVWSPRGMGVYGQSVYATWALGPNVRYFRWVIVRDITWATKPYKVRRPMAILGPPYVYDPFRYYHDSAALVTKSFDLGAARTRPILIYADAATPAGTAVAITKARTKANAGDAWGPWTNVLPGPANGAITPWAPSRYLEVEVQMSTSDTSVTPTIYAVGVYD